MAVLVRDPIPCSSPAKGMTQLFRDPGEKKELEPLLGEDRFSGAATKKKGKIIGATEQLR